VRVMGCHHRGHKSHEVLYKSGLWGVAFEGRILGQINILFSIMLA
jgi:hypothetical protein